MSKALLITGPTGLLGGYFLRDALLAGMRVAVLARPSGPIDAWSRIEAQLRDWESRLGRLLPRPHVLEGECSQPMLGLDDDSIRWIRDNCDSVLHCAASLRFRETADGEPSRTNVEGTRELLEMCRAAGIAHLHHVSTAYVAGRRTDRAHESELDVGQEFANVYEETKCRSEKLVRAAEFLESVTIHRPSIIVGDSETAWTSTYHGFYVVVQLLRELVRGLTTSIHDEPPLFEQLGLLGTEHKNLVPVDWVSKVMLRIVMDPVHRGRTYHQTNPRPITSATMERVATRAVLDSLDESRTDREPREVTKEDLLPHLEDYASYFRSDPGFDVANTLAAAPDLPCPELTDDVLYRIAKYALDSNFGWPKPRVERFDPRVDALLESLGAGSGDGDPEDSLLLELSGPGGGWWTVEFRDGLPVSALRETPRRNTSAVATSTTCFTELVDGSRNVPDTLAEGRMTVEFEGHHRTHVMGQLETLRRRLREATVGSRTDPRGNLVCTSAAS